MADDDLFRYQRGDWLLTVLRFHRFSAAASAVTRLGQTLAAFLTLIFPEWMVFPFLI
jgi:hypothetical protein